MSHFVLELFFDAETEQSVRNIWQLVDEMSGWLPPDRGNARPHLSVISTPILDLSSFAETVSKTCAAISPLTVDFASVGIFSFASGVIFLAPVVGTKLLALHTALIGDLQRSGASIPDLYTPGKWVPHCTLAISLPSDTVCKATELALQHLPLSGRVEQVGLVEIAPEGSSYVAVYSLTGDDSDDMEYAAPYVKVTAFVTREGDKGRELLVFRHPTGGVQLPAGSVEPGELIETAVLREVTEETGLEDIRVVSNLGVRTYPLPDKGCVVATQTMLYPAPGITSEGTSMRRGLTVHEIGRTKEYSLIEYREYVVRGEGLEISKVLLTGWVPVRDLSSTMERHFFHIKAPDSTPDEWTWFAEGEHDFSCYWVPISEDPGLVGGQDKWLSWFIDCL